MDILCALGWALALVSLVPVLWWVYEHVEFNGHSLSFHVGWWSGRLDKLPIDD